MKYIEVKGISEPVSQIVLGVTWADPTNQELFDQITDTYVSCGGNVIDAGRFYGAHGEAEVCIREWLKKEGNREKVLIMDKCCHPFVKRNGFFDENSRWRVSAELITEDLEFSLDRIGIDYFDLYLMHRDNEDIPVGELMDRLELHRKEGRIRAYGVSNWRKERVAEAVAYCEEKGYHGISLSSPSYSLATIINARWKGCVYIGDEEAKWYTQQNIPIFSYSAQGAGFFGQLPERLKLKDLSDAYVTPVNIEKLKRATELANEKGVSATNIALAYILNQGLLIAAVIGPRKVETLLDSIAAADIILTQKEIEYLSLRSDHR